MSATSVLDRYFQELEEQAQFSGVVLITQGKSQLYAGAYGYASRPWRIRNTLDMRFDTASQFPARPRYQRGHSFRHGRRSMETSMENPRDGSRRGIWRIVGKDEL
jgi:hypothetical protein